MLTGGVTPILPVDELGQLGYKIVVCPIESLLVAGKAIQTLNPGPADARSGRLAAKT